MSQKNIRLIHTIGKNAEITVIDGDIPKTFKFSNYALLVDEKEFDLIKKHPAFVRGSIKKQIKRKVKREEWVDESKSKLDRSIVDAKVPMFACEICEEEFQTVEELTDHTKKKHTTEVEPPVEVPTTKRTQKRGPNKTAKKE